MKINNFLKSALNMFKESKPLVFSRFDEDFLVFVKNKDLESMNDMLQEGYVPNTQILKRLRETAKASLLVKEFNFNVYSKTVTERFPSSYIDYEELLNAPLANSFINLMVKNKLLNEDFIQLFVTTKIDKIREGSFFFAEKKYPAKNFSTNDKKTLFKYTEKKPELIISNTYLWQDLLSQEQYHEKESLFQISNNHKINSKHSLLLNENPLLAGMILYKFKNPEKSFDEAKDFAYQRIKDEHHNILNNVGVRNIDSRINYMQKESFLNDVENINSNESNDNKILELWFFIDLVNDKKVTPQELFTQIVNNNYLKESSLNIVQSLIIIFQEDLINTKNSTKLYRLDNSNCFYNAYITKKISDNYIKNNPYDNNNQNNNPYDNNNQNNNVSNNQYIQNLKFERNDVDIPKRNVNLTDTLNSLRIQKATNSVMNLNLKELIDNPILRQHKQILLNFDEHYANINMKMLTNEEKEFVSNMYKEVINSVATYIEMKDLQLDGYSNQTITQNIETIIEQVKEIVKEQSLEQIKQMNQNKKMVKLKVK